MVPHIVLVVEDDQDIRESVCDRLRLEGVEVREAGDGARALEVLAEIGDQACLVLTDWDMPRMNGGELLEHMSARQKLATLPVIISSGADLSGPPKRLLRKPVSADTLMRVIREYCEQIR